MDYWIKFIIVMIGTFVLDVCYAMYCLSITKQNALKAALWGSSFYLTSAFVVINYTKDVTLVIAAVIGAFIGTYMTVKYNSRNGKG